MNIEDLLKILKELPNDVKMKLFFKLLIDKDINFIDLQNMYFKYLEYLDSMHKLCNSALSVSIIDARSKEKKRNLNDVTNYLLKSLGYINGGDITDINKTEDFIKITYGEEFLHYLKLTI